MPPWRPGYAPNPGGAPRGKRISTWLAEFGEMSEEELDKWRSKTNLPRNAKIALVRLDHALNPEWGLPDAAWAADRVEGKAVQSIRNATPQEPTMSLEEAAEIIKQLPGPGEF